MAKLRRDRSPADWVHRGGGKRIGWLRAERSWARAYCRNAAAAFAKFAKRRLSRLLRRNSKRAVEGEIREAAR